MDRGVKRMACIKINKLVFSGQILSLRIVLRNWMAYPYAPAVCPPCGSVRTGRHEVMAERTAA